MTYRKTNKCGLLCQLSMLIRRNRWRFMKRPLSWQIEASSYQAVNKHFSKGRY